MEFRIEVLDEAAKIDGVFLLWNLHKSDAAIDFTGFDNRRNFFLYANMDVLMSQLLVLMMRKNIRLHWH